MARINESELQHLKQAVSLVAIAQSQGRQLVKRGKDIVLLCPFHAEKTPSCVITPSKNLYHCFGCNAGGSVLDWVMQTENLSVSRAIDRLRRELGEMPPVAAAPLPPVDNIESDAERQALLNRVVEFYHHTLLNSEDAIAYLEKRKLNHPELVAHFKLGYANRLLGYRLPPKSKPAGAKIRSQLQQLGILRESGHEHLSGSLVVPVIDTIGHVHEMYGRKIGDVRVKRTAKHLYLPGAHRGIWNESALSASKSLILCESLIDAMSFWVSGHRNVTACYGVNGVTDELMTALIKQETKQVLIAFDNDVAGNEAALALAARLAEQGINCFRVMFPDGMDANSYLCSVADGEQELGVLLESAVPMSELHQAEIVENTTQETTSFLAASPLSEPVSNMPGVVTEPQANGDVFISLDNYQWKLRGVSQIKQNAAAMKVNAQLLDTQSGAVFADGVDLLSGRSRAAYARSAAVDLGVSASEVQQALGKVLLALEHYLANPQAKGDEKEKVSLTEEQKTAALELLQSNNLVERITSDLSACGVVGESTNLLAGYLAAVSRKLDKPLAILIQSSSAAGKSSLMDAVLNLLPGEEKICYSAMTGQSLFYLGETNLQHKVLAIAEEEGVRQAAYALKLLQSDGELTIASTGKDDSTGNLVTKQYTVKGPVMLLLTTTAIDIDEELLNRCLVLTVNESREQTEAIHAQQRYAQTLEGLLAESEKGYLTELHQNAQRLLRPLKVVNPYASQLTFLSDKTRTRRDHMKYLTLIQSIALLHQYQREVKQVEHRGDTLSYIEVTKGDIALANQLAHEILGRTLDELPPQTRKLLVLIRDMVNDLAKQSQAKFSEVRFTRRDIREYTQWSDSQLKNHCQRLADMEYLLIHAGHHGQLLRYELLWDGVDEQTPYLCGLINSESDKNRGYDVSKSGLNGGKSTPSLPQVRAKSGLDKSLNGLSDKALEVSGLENVKSLVPQKHH